MNGPLVKCTVVIWEAISLSDKLTASFPPRGPWCLGWLRRNYSSKPIVTTGPWGIQEGQCLNGTTSFCVVACNSTMENRFLTISLSLSGIKLHRSLVDLQYINLTLLICHELGTPTLYCGSSQLGFIGVKVSYNSTYLSIHRLSRSQLSYVQYRIVEDTNTNFG